MGTLEMGQVKEKIGLQIGGLLMLSSPLCYMYAIYPIFNGGAHFQPAQRGFFCDDENLRRPYIEHVWVSTFAALVIWVAILLATVIPIEILVEEEDKKKTRSLPTTNEKIPWLAFHLYRILGYAFLGNVACVVATEVSKYTVGRLRPHFLTICDPFDSMNLTCDGDYGYKRFVEITDADCFLYSNGTYSERQLRMARLSFMSGHSSFSFFNAAFLVVYIHTRLARFHSNEGHGRILVALKRLRPFIQFGFIILAFWIALTRISDYFHHPGDVIMGALTGLITATLTILFTGVFFQKSSQVPTDDQTRDKSVVGQGASQEYKTQKTDISLI